LGTDYPLIDSATTVQSCRWTFGFSAFHLILRRQPFTQRHRVLLQSLFSSAGKWRRRGVKAAGEERKGRAKATGGKMLTTAGGNREGEMGRRRQSQCRLPSLTGCRWRPSGDKEGEARPNLD